MIVLLVVEVGFIVWVSKRYYAEVKYREALVDLQKNNVDGALNSLGQASMAVQNMQDNYLTALAQGYLAKANQVLGQANQQNPSAKDTSAISSYLTLAVEYAQQAADKVNPNNIANWSVKGYVFSQLAAAKVPGNMADTAQQSYQKAIALEPSNSSLWLQTGQVMLIKNDLAQAKADFQKAVDLNPNFSDARYFLGLIEDQQGDKQGAIDQFVAIAQLNPDNQTIAQILQNLRAGKPAFGDQSQQAPAQTSGTLPSVPTSLQEQQSMPGALPTPANSSDSQAPAPQGQTDNNTTVQGQADQQSLPSSEGDVTKGAAAKKIPVPAK
jgi:tetratricopeptide (TPR) repeat protein